MTGGGSSSTVLSAVQVDMASNVPTQLTPLDFRRRRPSRTSARVCLFGAPEPGETRKLYNEMLEKNYKHMLFKYNFDIKQEKFIEQESFASSSSSSSQNATLASSSILSSSPSSASSSSLFLLPPPPPPLPKSVQNTVMDKQNERLEINTEYTTDKLRVNNDSVKIDLVNDNKIEQRLHDDCDHQQNSNKTKITNQFNINIDCNDDRNKIIAPMIANNDLATKSHTIEKTFDVINTEKNINNENILTADHQTSFTKPNKNNSIRRVSAVTKPYDKSRVITGYFKKIKNPSTMANKSSTIKTITTTATTITPSTTAMSQPLHRELQKL